jgi:hypothetical protein
MRFHSPHSQLQRNFCAASTLKPVQKGKRKIRFQTCGRMGSLWATKLVSIKHPFQASFIHLTPRFKIIPQCKVLSSYLTSTKVLFQNRSKSKQKVMS